MPVQQDPRKTDPNAPDAQKVTPANSYNFQDQANQYSGGQGQGNLTFTGSKEEQQGQLAGLELAKLGYGQDIFQTGKDIQRVRELQKQRTAQAGGDPVSAAIMGQKASAVAGAQRNLAAQGVKGGVAAGAVDAIARQRDSDIAASLYGQQRQSLADERSLAGNTLAGTVSLMQGSKAEGTAGSQPLPPQSKGLMDSVICTELHRQGILDTEAYLKDAEFGKVLKQSNPNVIVGYHFLAKPVVKIMRKSPLFTKVISYPTLKWAYYIAGRENSVIGAFIFHVGIPVCSVIGTIKMKIVGEKYVQL
jgi:hypothetical protein